MLILRLLPLVLFISSVSAQNLPELGDASEATLSSQRERVIGDAIMRDIRKDAALLDDTEVNDYLNKLGAALVARNVEKDRSIEFFIVKDATLNAFALPGGYIGVHTGLILAAQNESELAGVLAHEIAHLTQRHLARMISRSKESMLPSLAALAVAILAARSSPQLANAALATAQATSIQSQLDFSREHEREADRVGLSLLNDAGFDPRAMPAFFERFQRAGRVYESSAPNYLRTHPVTTERIADILNRVEAMRYRQVVDGPDFQLIRAKLRSLEGTPQEAANFFKAGLVEKKFSSEAAYRYGLAWALLRVKNYQEAEDHLQKLRQLHLPHPLIFNLAAQIKVSKGDIAAAKTEYQKGLAGFPQHRALVYGYANALLLNKEARAALKLITEGADHFSPDAKLYELRARGYALSEQTLLEHQALAEASALRSNYGAAIEQLEIAIKAKSGNFYQLSSIEARLRELRRMEKEAKTQEKTLE